MDINVKVVVVGDGAVGKTCLLHRFMKGEFLEDYVPTIFENQSTVCSVDGRNVNISLWDTAGQEEYDRLRPLSYPSTDVFLVAYSIDSPTSYRNVLDKWVPELKHHAGKTPMVLVATKTDLRDDPATIQRLQAEGMCLQHQHGVEMKNKIGADRYLECSSKTGDGIKRVFEEAVRLKLKPKGPPARGSSSSKKCLVL